MGRELQVQALAPLSDMLGGLILSGQTWCYCDLGPDGGYSLPRADVLWFHAVLHGSVRIAAPSGDMAELHAGDVLALPGGAAHALRCTAQAQAAPLDFLREERSLDAPPAFAIGKPGAVQARLLSARLAVELPPGTARTSLPTFLHLGSAASQPWGALLAPGALAQAAIGPGSAALLTRLAGLILIAHLRADPACRAMLGSAGQDPIDQALGLIAGNPSAAWTVERLARSVGMGRSNFAAHFTGKLGRAPMEVVAEARMEQAAALLRKGSLKIAEISELCGYGSEAAFSRRFTRHFGLSPSALREAARAEQAGTEAQPAPWQPLLSAARDADTAARLRSRPVGPGAVLGGKR